MKRVFLIIMAAMIFTSCYKSELSNTTHPNKGKVVLRVTLPTLDPSADNDEATVPESYTLIMGGEEFEIGKEGTVELTDNLEPGVYTIYVYSNTADIEMQSNITDTGKGTIVSSTIVDASMITSLTEDLYFGTQIITVLADQVINSEIALLQVTRTIKFNLNLTEGDIDDIVAIKATLGGMAQQWECIENIPIGDVATISPAFAQGESLTKAAANDYLTSSIKVLGINGDEQHLNLELTFANGNTQSFASDVSDQLAGSNNTKSNPITLSGSLKANTEVGATGTITDWEVSEGEYDFDANQPNE